MPKRRKVLFSNVGLYVNGKKVEIYSKRERFHHFNHHIYMHTMESAGIGIAIMFIGSWIIHYYLMSYIMVDKAQHVRSSVGKAYMATLMAIWMVGLEVMMMDVQHGLFSKFYYILIGAATLVLIVMYRWQIGISDKEYLQEMTEHHSMAILTSKTRAQKENVDPKIKLFASSIIQTQEQEIIQMQSMAV